MGTWGTGAFDNDTAADWLYALEEVDDLSLIETTIASVLDGDDVTHLPQRLARRD
jgi:hypothetical protein